MRTRAVVAQNPVQACRYGGIGQRATGASPVISGWVGACIQD
jgi:hypothetical protein